MFGPDSCESLHGHDYRVEAELGGTLAPTGWILDFQLIESLLGEIIRPFDHRLLLPERSPWLTVECSDEAAVVTLLSKRWRFLRRECVLVPIGNVTAELLAQHIGEQFWGSLQEKMPADFDCLTRLAVQLYESPHYSARWMRTK